MRKMIWCATALSVAATLGVYGASEYAARNPESSFGRAFASAAQHSPWTWASNGKTPTAAEGAPASPATPAFTIPKAPLKTPGDLEESEPSEVIQIQVVPWNCEREPEPFPLSPQTLEPTVSLGERSSNPPVMPYATEDVVKGVGGWSNFEDTPATNWENSADKNQRMLQLLDESEDLRQIKVEWQRFWFADEPSHLTYERVHGGVGPLVGQSDPDDRHVWAEYFQKLKVTWPRIDFVPPPVGGPVEPEQAELDSGTHRHFLADFWHRILETTAMPFNLLPFWGAPFALPGTADGLAVPPTAPGEESEPATPGSELIPILKDAPSHHHHNDGCPAMMCPRPYYCPPVLPAPVEQPETEPTVNPDKKKTTGAEEVLEHRSLRMNLLEETLQFPPTLDTMDYRPRDDGPALPSGRDPF